MTSAALLVLVGAALPVAWDLELLCGPPRCFPAPDYSAEFDAGAGNPELCFSGEKVRALMFAGLPWEGRATRVFAWYGCPPAGAGGRVPAMVLVHGGGGTAFDEWVRIWNRRGYAAIAMDTTGTRPGGIPGARPRHAWGGPPHEAFVADIDKPVKDQWLYHAVADVVLAHSLIRSFPEVDPDRIGLTGISWGGFLACLAAGVDDRFRFAVPVYGCGFHDASARMAGQWRAMGEAKAAKWFGLWDPSHYLPDAGMPLLMLTGSSDFFAPLHMHAKSAALPPGPVWLCTPVGLGHSHVHGWSRREIYAFADSMLREGPSLARCVETGQEGATVWARFEAAQAVRGAVLVWTGDAGDWVDCSWRETPAQWIAGMSRSEAVLPPKAEAYFFNVETASGLLTSSPMRCALEEE